jgi:hypothetical protein
MTKPTSAARVAAFRARKAQAGETEVRNIFAPLALHRRIKESAQHIKAQAEEATQSSPQHKTPG